MLTEFLTSLKVRILGGIFLVFFLAMGMVLYGLWTYQRDRLIEITTRNAMQTASTIEAGLRSSMLLNDRRASMKTIRNMLQIEQYSQISILDKTGKIVMTSQPSLAGKVINKDDETTGLICHAGGRTKNKTTAIINRGDDSFIRTVTAIKSETACYSCHPQGQRIIGMLLIDSSLKKTNALLGTMAKRIALTGLFVFVVGVILLNLIVTRFFTRPVEALQVGFEKIGRGDFTYWVDVNCGGELSHMADAFNVMSRAIGRYVEEVKGKRQEVSAHYSIVQSLSETIEKKKLLELVIDLLIRILDVDCAAFALPVEKETDVFMVVSTKKGDQRHYHTYNNLESDFHQICALTQDDLSALLNGKYSSEVYSDDNAKLLIPVQQKNLMPGLISVLKTKGECFSQTEKNIVPVLAHHITVSFANAELYHLAITDGLTKLFTKRYFEKKLIDFVENFHTGKRGFCVMMFDIDHFKEVNDTHGHPVGDQVLVRIASLIRLNIRHGDIACRYGGEEFIVLFKGDDIDGAADIAERTRKKIEEFIFTIKEIPPFNTTVSAGVACFPGHALSGDDVVADADAALYQAKRSGRNQVVVYNA